VSVFIIDANSTALWNYENYTAIPSYDSDRRVIYGFLRMFHRIVTEYEAERIIIVDDQFSLSGKNHTLSSYKQTKYIPPFVCDELRDLERITSFLNIEHCIVNGLDSLDVIASLAKDCSVLSDSVYIISDCRLLDQCVTQKVKRWIPRFARCEKEKFDVYCEWTPSVPIERMVDYFILNGYWEYDIPRTLDDLGLSEGDSGKIVSTQSLSDFLKKHEGYDSETHQKKIEMIRKLVTSNPNLEFPSNFCSSSYNNPPRVDNILQVASRYGLDAFLLNEFPRGTAYPPNFKDKRERDENNKIVGSTAEFGSWSIKRLAEVPIMQKVITTTLSEPRLDCQQHRGLISTQSKCRLPCR
jgi:hypothetical protein